MDPFKPLTEARKTPVFIIWEGAPRGHGDLINSLEFVAAAKASGKPVTFLKSTHSEWERQAIYNEFFSWFLKQKATDPNSDTAQQYRWPIGPLANIFSDRFILVIGTQGDASDSAAIKSVVEGFQNSWLKAHFSPAPATLDSAVTSEQLANSNLILIGSSRSNSVWAKFSDNIPILIKDGAVELSGHVHRGSSLGFHGVFRHPENPKTRIAVLKATSIRDSSVPLNLEEEGWYEYAIWDTGGSRPESIFVHDGLSSTGRNN